MKTKKAVIRKTKMKSAVLQGEDKTIDGTAQKIKKVATALFASKGFKSTSVKDITDHAKVNIAAINYHFKSKENLLQEIVKDYGSMNLESVKRTLKKVNNLTDLKLRFEIAMGELFNISCEFRDLMRIMQREVYLIPDVVRDTLIKGLLEVNEIFFEFFETAKEKKLVKKDVDTSQLILFIYSYLTTLSANEMLPLFKPYRDKDISDLEYRDHAIETLCEILFSGVSTEKSKI